MKGGSLTGGRKYAPKGNGKDEKEKKERAKGKRKREKDERMIKSKPKEDERRTERGWKEDAPLRTPAKDCDTPPPKLHVCFQQQGCLAQTRESQRIYITTYYSTPYISKRTFNPLHSTLHVAARHVSHPGTCLTARRKTPDRGEDGHLSQRDTWPIATRSSVWPVANAQKRDFRSLVCTKTRHNFLTKKHNKA